MPVLRWQSARRARLLVSSGPIPGRWLYLTGKLPHQGLSPQHGPGKKHLRKIELTEWQQVIVERYPGEFARGLLHSDGCRALNRVRRRLESGERWYEYPRYLFVNESADILFLCGQTLDQLGVEWRFSKPNTISVAKRDAVARLDEFVGPKY